MLFQEIEGSFAEEVEKLASTTGSYIDSVIQLCENYNIEPQVAAKMSKRLRRKAESQILCQKFPLYQSKKIFKNYLHYLNDWGIIIIVSYTVHAVHNE